jgi:adenylate cyclase
MLQCEIEQIAGLSRYETAGFSGIWVTAMNESDIHGITAWLIEQGLAGLAEADLLAAFCTRCREAGVDLARGLTIIDTLHPVHEGRAFRWRNDGVEETAMIEYGRTSEGEAQANWQRSPFYHLLSTGGSELRRNDASDEFDHFNLSRDLQAQGQTDYVVFVNRFAGDGVIGEMDCVYSYWATAHSEGFREDDLGALRRLVPALSLALKSVSLARIPGTLAEVYLGRDAGQRVVRGRIQRGVTDRISAVLWFSDLRGYTTISDTAEPEEIIPLLNDYADAVICAVYDAGGDVLKLMGDGTLAIFKADDPAEACASALSAEAALRAKLKELNARRLADGRPVTQVYLGLHIGEVFYGNIGSEERLDFTVVGPAVNEVSRIASICRSVDRHLVVSSAFASQVPVDARTHLVSLGRYALRGVGRAQELFTLDPGVL